jgi:hypothetical protein
MKNIKTEYTEVINFEKHGRELYFKAIPTYEERSILKANGYRWHNQKKCWYISDKKANSTQTTKQTKTESQNVLGIKVGDIFEMSWGYEQTNVDFFRVKELRGKTQVVLQEVHLAMIEEEAVNGMSANRRYDVNNYKVAERSVHVDDNEKGIIKQVKLSKYNGKAYVNMASYANAHLYKGETVYESWYY